MLEQRKKAEEEEEEWRERQKKREKRLQGMVLKRAHANDPHQALSQTHPSKLKEFRCAENRKPVTVTISECVAANNIGLFWLTRLYGHAIDINVHPSIVIPLLFYKIFCW